MKNSILPKRNFQIQGRIPSDVVRKHWEYLLTDYERSGLAPPHLRSEAVKGCSGEEQKLWACLWEAMLFRHFNSLGFKFRTDILRKSGQDGPDFGLLHGNGTIWIEATVPEPTGLPDEWLAPFPSPTVRSVPNEGMLLRWTGALRNKRIQYEKRLENKIVAEEDAYIVAINSCMLSVFPREDHGISQLPFVVEAVFPIGPIGIPLSKDGRADGPPVRMPRYAIKRPNKPDAPTDFFLNPENAGISALVGCSQNHMLDGDLPLIGCYNPLSRNPVASGILGIKTEYFAEIDESGADTFVLRRYDR